MNLFCVFNRYFFLFFFLSFSLNRQITFNGIAGTSDWHTAANWSLNRLPLASDKVIIPNGFTVNVSADAVARNIKLQGSTLNVMAGTLTVDENMMASDGFVFEDGGMLSIDAGATLIIKNTENSGIHVSNSTGNLAIINNAGTFTIGPDIGDPLSLGMGEVIAIMEFKST